MTCHPYSQLVHYKQWADRGLHEVAGRNLERLPPQEAAILIRILDHIHAVDRIFQHHLQGSPHGLQAPRSEDMPDFQALVASTAEVDAWYTSYVDGLPTSDFDQPVEFLFTDGTPARMLRSEILLHVCLHGTYHRGMPAFFSRRTASRPMMTG